MQAFSMQIEVVNPQGHKKGTTINQSTLTSLWQSSARLRLNYGKFYIDLPKKPGWVDRRSTHSSWARVLSGLYWPLEVCHATFCLCFSKHSLRWQRAKRGSARTMFAS